MQRETVNCQNLNFTTAPKQKIVGRPLVPVAAEMFCQQQRQQQKCRLHVKNVNIYLNEVLFGHRDGGKIVEPAVCFNLTLNPLIFSTAVRRH